MTNKNIRTQFDRIKSSTEAELLAVFRRGCWEMEMALFDDVDDAQQALEKAQSAGVATPADKAEVQRLTAEADAAAKANDPARAARAREELNAFAKQLRDKTKAPTTPPPADPARDPKPKPTDGTTAPAWFAAYTENFGATDKDGNPTKAASESDVAQLREEMDGVHAQLRYERHDDGTTTWGWREQINTDGSSFNWFIGGVAAVVTFIVALLLMWGPGDAIFTSALMWSGMLAIVILFLAGALTSRLQRH